MKPKVWHVISHIVSCREKLAPQEINYPFCAEKSQNLANIGGNNGNIGNIDNLNDVNIVKILLTLYTQFASRYTNN
jgi:hypothetical protein